MGIGSFLGKLFGDSDASDGAGQGVASDPVEYEGLIPSPSRSRKVVSTGRREPSVNVWVTKRSQPCSFAPTITPISRQRLTTRYKKPNRLFKSRVIICLTARMSELTGSGR